MRPLILLFVLATALPARAATFGDQTAYTSNFGIRDVVCLAPAASPVQTGLGDSITALLRISLDSCKLRCALYSISGSDTVLVPNSVTEERRFALNNVFVWHGFAFPGPKPQVTAGMQYLIATFGDSAGTTSGGLPRSAVVFGPGTGVYLPTNYESGFPTPINPTSPSNFKMSAYVTYTPTAATLPRRRLVISRSQPAP